MRCPSCGHLENRVIDSRLAQGGEVTRRRRECDGCAHRYTTYERIEHALPLVIKKDERREPFDRVKILNGLRRACVKRPISAETMDRIVDDMERELMMSAEKEISSQSIGEKVLAALRDLDEVAYVRFASVYRTFQDTDEFTKELSSLLKTRSKTT